ncbi:uncharacterized protein TNCV_2929251 [Trichonephila clavipes]|nr:uncharacterized protein TNCV_2929251 [Trichonephila clavipes]
MINKLKTAHTMMVNCSSAPTSRTETPPSDASPQTPPAAASGSSPSRRNSDRRKRSFVRKNTQSAPDSFDNDDDSYTGVPTITQTSVDPIDGPNKRPEGLSIGYFNFDSMQRLLDLSITASTKPEKPSFLLTPGEKLTVWSALWAGGILGPYFFINDEGYNVTVNSNRYRAMITNFFIPELNNHDVQELWFQQDGARCHTARATIDLLKDTFGDRLISCFGPVNWPPRS